MKTASSPVADTALGAAGGTASHSASDSPAARLWKIPDTLPSCPALLGMLGAAIFTILQASASDDRIETVAPLSGGTFAGLVEGSDGILYGTTQRSGSFFKGTVFSVTPAGVVTTLAEFDGANGANPQAALSKANDGNFYGTTQSGGANNAGTVFQVTPAGGLTTLLSFDGINVRNPFGGVIQGRDGNFYGVTRSGGTFGLGAVYKVAPTGMLTVLASLNGSNGSFATAALVERNEGEFYGTTQFGGVVNYDLGTVFKVSAAGVFTTVMSLGYGANNGVDTGSYPRAELIHASDGNLYGTTFGSPESNRLGASVFKVSGSGKFTQLAEFAYSAGQPAGGLLEGQDGAFYGTTVNGGNLDNGTIFRITPNGAMTIVASLNGPNRRNPHCTLAQGSDGNFYGTTSGVKFGGVASSSTVFRVLTGPMAEPGDDQSVNEGEAVALDGSKSDTLNGRSLSYAWTQVLGSPIVQLHHPQHGTASFSAPEVALGGTTLTFELTVSDGIQSSVGTVNVRINNVNHAPVADAGHNQTVPEQSAVTLDGSGSFDTDADHLTFAWIQLAGTPVILSDASAASPSFTAPFVTGPGDEGTFQLTVDDGYRGTAKDDVRIKFQNINDPPEVERALPSEKTIWPPDHRMVPISIERIQDRGHNATTIITGVTQDEPTSGLGGGDTPIDAIINGDGTVLLRAERSEQGDGRVYWISFTSSDLEGSASGVVKVIVPLNSRRGSAIDGGQQWDSTQ